MLVCSAPQFPHGVIDRSGQAEAHSGGGGEGQMFEEAEVVTR